jgi:acyl-CoA thioesterase
MLNTSAKVVRIQPVRYFSDNYINQLKSTPGIVRAVQGGKLVFVLMCSFQKPELHQPSHSWHMPTVPDPEECELVEALWTREVMQESKDERIQSLYRINIEVDYLFPLIAELLSLFAGAVKEFNSLENSKGTPSCL